MTERLKRRDDREARSWSERALLVASIALTTALLGYVAWHAVTAPQGAIPKAEVLGIEEAPDGEPAARIRLTNDGGVGLQDATMEVACGDEPPVEVEFQHVPAGGHREGHATCPGGAAEARVVAWREA